MMNAKKISLHKNSILISNKSNQKDELAKEKHQWRGFFFNHLNWNIYLKAQYLPKSNEPKAKMNFLFTKPLNFKSFFPLFDKKSKKNFWNYLEYLETNGSKLDFFQLNSNSTENGSQKYDKHNKKYMNIPDETLYHEMYSKLANNNSIMEIEITSEYSESIGYMYVMPIKNKDDKKPDPSFKKKFSISLFRNKDLLIAVLVDSQSKQKFCLESDWTLSDFVIPKIQQKIINDSNQISNFDLSHNVDKTLIQSLPQCQNVTIKEKPKQFNINIDIESLREELKKSNLKKISELEDPCPQKQMSNENLRNEIVDSVGSQKRDINQNANSFNHPSCDQISNKNIKITNSIEKLSKTSISTVDYIPEIVKKKKEWEYEDVSDDDMSLDDESNKKKQEKNSVIGDFKINSNLKSNQTNIKEPINLIETDLRNDKLNIGNIIELKYDSKIPYNHMLQEFDTDSNENMEVIEEMEINVNNPNKENKFYEQFQEVDLTEEENSIEVIDLTNEDNLNQEINLTDESQSAQEKNIPKKQEFFIHNESKKYLMNNYQQNQEIKNSPFVFFIKGLNKLNIKNQFELSKYKKSFLEDFKSDLDKYSIQKINKFVENEIIKLRKVKNKIKLHGNNQNIQLDKNKTSEPNNKPYLDMRNNYFEKSKAYSKSFNYKRERNFVSKSKFNSNSFIQNFNEKSDFSSVHREHDDYGSFEKENQKFQKHF